MSEDTYNKTYNKMDTYKLDKTAFSVTHLHEQDPLEETRYWLAKPLGERLAALEFLRQVMYGYDAATARLQRVFETAERTRR